MDNVDKNVKRSKGIWLNNDFHELVVTQINFKGHRKPRRALWVNSAAEILNVVVKLSSSNMFSCYI